MKPAFRPDIEGLRGLAVLAVVMFHYGIPPLSGGFVGVDVFFVISGYLIAAIAAAEGEAGRFSVAVFYGRRLRRILPALLVLLAFCSLASLFVFLPNDLRLVGSSVAAAALFTSNVFFLSLAKDYFAADNLTQQPLLHTWSLGVEAQFYLVFPLLLVASRRFGLSPRTAVAVLLALSLAGSVWGAAYAPGATFYLLPARAWEPLLGAALALGAVRLPVLPGAAGAAGGLGLALILIAALAFDRTTPFPGAAALLPCVGAALVIASGEKGGQGRALAGVLGAAPLAFVGRISYSLYLWHWPLLVLAGYGSADGLGPGTRVALLAGTMAIAVLSWRFVERPFIARTLLPSGRGLAAGALVATVVLASGGLAVALVGRGVLPFARLPPEVLALAAGEFDRLEGECRPSDADAATGLPCRFGAPGAAPTVVLWGNSYARMWLPALDADGARAGVAGVSLVRSKCPPLLDTEIGDAPDCRGFNGEALAFIGTRPAVTTVVLGANWFAFDDRLAETLDRTLAALARGGKKIVVVLAPPQAAYSVPRTLALAALRHVPAPPPILESDARAAQRRSTEAIEALRQRYGFAVIDPATTLCDGHVCAVAQNGRPLFSDAGHVTRSTAAAATALFEPVFRP